MRIHSVVIGLAIVAGAACVQTPPPRVPIVAIDTKAVMALAGRWSGSYRGDQTNRVGSIEFSLNAAGDSATGSVVLMDEKGMNVVRPVDTPDQHLRHATSSQQLWIRFVGVRGDEVFGKLEAYVAPDCDCMVSTSFTGRVVADSVTGTFFTEHASTGLTQTGTWKVFRRIAANADR